MVLKGAATLFLTTFAFDLFDTTLYKTEEKTSDERRVDVCQVRPFNLKDSGIQFKTTDVLQDFYKKVDTFQPDVLAVTANDFTIQIAETLLKDFKNKFCGDSKEDIIQLMRDRDFFGYAKYKVHLKVHNGRSFYNDLIQELLDSACYAKGLCEESPFFDDNLQDIYYGILKLLVLAYESYKEANG